MRPELPEGWKIALSKAASALRFEADCKDANLRHAAADELRSIAATITNLETFLTPLYLPAPHDRQAEAALAWQPIETFTEERIRIIGAVKDFVVGDIFYGPASIQLARCNDREYVSERNGKAWRYTHGEDRLLDHHIPTHWMPLPGPPE